VYGTADLALRHRAKLQPGQTVLVLGASGGVGTAAVQVRHMDMRTPQLQQAALHVLQLVLLRLL
jgi:D-arabinose 1-dehydrogenase-like Zn-dependent alcohol dehydrogenase